MLRQELEQKIIQDYPGIKQTNLRNLKKFQLESWVNQGEITVSKEDLVRIFLERNKRAEINQRLNNENFRLVAKLYSKLTDWSKSEIIQGFKQVFGRVTQADDLWLNEIGASSNESVRQDLEKAQEVVQEAKNVATQYRKKYGEP